MTLNNSPATAMFAAPRSRGVGAGAAWRVAWRDAGAPPVAGAPLLAKVKLVHPDLVLVDWELPDQPMFVLIPQLHKCNPNLIVVMMSSKPEYGSMLLSAGADAFVSKSEHPDWIVETLHKYEIHST